MKTLTLKLTKRADGRFAKRIDGQYRTWPDEKSARAEIIGLMKARESGQTAEAPWRPPIEPTLRMIANQFRHHRQQHVKPATWTDYHNAIDQFLNAVGKHRLPSSLKPDDFKNVRDTWSKTLGPWKIDSRVQSVRTMFKWAFESARLIGRLPWYGDSFKKSTVVEKRRVRREKTSEHGDRVFTADELKQIHKAITGPLKAFFLLGLNGGMYAADIAQMAPADLRIEGRYQIIDNDRLKTGVRRKFVLWPETIEAMKNCRKGTDTLFITTRGNPWVVERTNSIQLLFSRFLDDLGIKRVGVNFGAVRHTHVSAVGDHPDLNAARLVRGHHFGGIESHYDFPNLKRIKAVTDLARERLVSRPLRPQKKRSPSRGNRDAA